VRLAAIITKAPLIPDGPVLKGKVCTKCYKCIEKCPVHAIGETPPVPPDNFNRKRCIWGAAFGFYKASGGQQPPEEWANAETLQDMTALIPKYKEMYPRINYYTNLSAKVMGYPNCTECYKYCSVGMDSRKVMADRD
jgi:ferredoxin